MSTTDNTGNMNKLKALCIFFLITSYAQLSTAQTSINKIQTLPNRENTSPAFIEGISFTPEGILKSTESGGSKSVRSVAAPVVTKTNAENNSEETGSVIEKFTNIQFKYAMMLDVEVESLKNLALLGFIDNWFGIRYRMGGTTKKGIDCSALTSSLLMAVYGCSVPRTARQQYQATTHIKKDNLKEGDLVFFNTRGGVSHVGLYLDNDYFVHASSSDGVTISNLNDEYYSKRFICGGRVETD